MTTAAMASDRESTSPFEEWEIDRFEWQERLEDAHTVSVTNVFGDIRARTSKDDEIALLAVLQHADGETEMPTVTVDREGGRVIVTVEMPDAKRADDARRVDISLFVPRQARFEARTHAGLIEAKKLASEIEALTERGEIRVSTSGTVDLQSTHGPVTVTLLSSSWSAPPEITTTTGGIEAWLPRDVDAEVVAETGGLITTDYSVNVAYDERTAIKRATARIGASTTTIRLTSAKGNIRILRSAIRPRATTRGDSADDASGRE